MKSKTYSQNQKIIPNPYLKAHNESMQDQYQKDNYEIETIIAVISQAQQFQSDINRDPIHFVFIIDDYLFLAPNYLEQFKYFVTSYSSKMCESNKENDIEIRDTFSVYFTFINIDSNSYTTPYIDYQLFSATTKEIDFYDLFLDILQSSQLSEYIQAETTTTHTQVNPTQKLQSIFNIAQKESNCANQNTSIVLISSFLNSINSITSAEIEKLVLSAVPKDQQVNYRFHAISLRMNRFEMLQELTCSTLGYYYYASDVERQQLLYALDQIVRLHSKPYLKNYTIELQFHETINLIKSIYPCTKWDTTSSSKSAYQIHSKYFYAYEEKISLVCLVLNATDKIGSGTHKIGSVIHSFQLPPFIHTISYSCDILISLSSDASYSFNPSCIIFFEQCKFIQLALKILLSLLRFDWATLDQNLPRLREVFQIYISDTTKYQTLIRSQKYLLERITVFKKSFSPQTRHFHSNIYREILSHEECYNQIQKMIEYLHNLNHFLVLID